MCLSFIVTWDYFQYLTLSTTLLLETAVDSTVNRKSVLLATWCRNSILLSYRLGSSFCGAHLTGRTAPCALIVKESAGLTLPGTDEIARARKSPRSINVLGSVPVE